MIDPASTSTVCFPVIPFCPILIWLVLVGFFLAISLAVHDGITRLKRLHQIPCTRCAFFTGDYRLKCTVHPCKALSEEAINCLDYEPAVPQPIFSLQKNSSNKSISPLGNY